MSTKSDTRALVTHLKEAGQDHEFYPTSDRMIQRILDHVRTDQFHEMVGHRAYNRFEIRTVLDVGAGAGAFLQAAKKHEEWANADLLAIERSQILINHLVQFSKVIGCDFHAQSFLPKQVDVLFSNPPYLEYEAWAARLIKECPAKVLYLVIPQRWKDSALIRASIEFREARVEVIGSDDFLDADRRSRAHVDILCVVPTESREEGNDLFTRFFLEKFGHLKARLDDAQEQERKQAENRNSMVQRDGLVGALVKLYDAEMAKLSANYEKAASLDADLLGALKLDIQTIVNTLGAHIDSLKQRYWEELFRNLDTVTSRLTSKNQRALLDTIGGFKAVDFAAENIYAVLLWIIEHANRYIDSQILDVFDTMLAKANIRNYKSNQKVYGEGRYRYQQETPTHVSLDYRIVIESGCHGFRSPWQWEKARLSDTGREFVGDLLCVATLLGFPSKTDDQTEWVPGKPVMFRTVDGEEVVEVKAYKNGNMHVRMSQKLMIALNVAVGKLRGWLRDHHEAKAEFGEAASVAGVDVEHLYAKDHHMTPRMLNLPGPRAA